MRVGEETIFKVPKREGPTALSELPRTSVAQGTARGGHRTLAAPRTCGATAEWQAESGAGVRVVTTVEGDRWNLWAWNCRLLGRPLCCYCECERGPGPGESLSGGSLAPPPARPGHWASLQGPRFSLVCTLVNWGCRQSPFGLFSRLFQKGGFFLSHFHRHQFGDSFTGKYQLFSFSAQYLCAKQTLRMMNIPLRLGDAVVNVQYFNLFLGLQFPSQPPK